MNLGATRSRLNALTRELAARWQETRESWTDAKCDEFEKTYLQGLFVGVDKAGTAIEQLDEVLTRVRRDCE